MFGGETQKPVVPGVQVQTGVSAQLQVQEQFGDQLPPTASAAGAEVPIAAPTVSKAKIKSVTLRMFSPSGSG